jgi:hypothetical protein
MNLPVGSVFRVIQFQWIGNRAASLGAASVQFGGMVAPCASR